MGRVRGTPAEGGLGAGRELSGMTNPTGSSLFEGPEFSGSAGATDDVADTNAIDAGTARAVLEHIARSIVDDPDAVVVEASPSRGGTKLSLHVNPSDMGRIIGRRGRVAQALRTVVRAAGTRDGTETTVDIAD